MIRRHQRDRRAAQDPRAVELAAVEQHLAEAQVIGRGRNGAGAPESFFGGFETSISLFGAPLAGSTAKGGDSRAILSAGTEKPVSVIFSGLNSRSSRNSDRRLPDAFSTTRPSTSTARLYSQVVPGW